MANPPHELPRPRGDELDEGADAIAEAAAFAGGVDLSSRTELNKIKRLLRQDALDGHLHRILVIGLYLFALCAALMFGSLIWSLAFPDYAMLNAEQSVTLQKFLFSGAVGSAVTAAAQKVSGGKEAEKG
ncbi:hypothetical protein [Novosphingobium sp.]|uniref:hypothetical protein n=1 Tax=Novosphingobium sp. TaxID=1874826 RepID=UPI00286E9C78|nr:hypothetical protein [Novosphingobium sp.]